MTKLPLLSPIDSLEALELLEDVASLLRNTAKFASLRKDIRIQLENSARECESLAAKIRRVDTFDESLLNGIDALSVRSGHSFQALLKDAMEAFISAANRKG